MRPCSYNHRVHVLLMIIHLLQRKEKTLGSLSEDNEEERDEMPVISKEQCINNETPTVRGLAADKKKQIVHGNYDLLME